MNGLANLAAARRPPKKHHQEWLPGRGFRSALSISDRASMGGLVVRAEIDVEKPTPTDADLPHLARRQRRIWGRKSRNQGANEGRFAMVAAVRVRGDFTAQQLRDLARGSRCARWRCSSILAIATPASRFLRGVHGCDPWGGDGDKNKIGGIFGGIFDFIYLGNAENYDVLWGNVSPTWHQILSEAWQASPVASCGSMLRVILSARTGHRRH